MKQLFFMLCVVLLASCKNSTEENLETKPTQVQEDYESEEDGVYRAFYGGNNQLKTEGNYDANGKKSGVWTHYFPDGRKQSVTEFKNGLKDGFSIVYHMNGSIYYSGEYRDDKMVGVWSYYDVQTGKKDKVKDYGYPGDKK